MQCLSGTLSLLVAKVLPAQPFFLRAKRRRPPATSSIVSLLNYIKLAQPQKARAKLFKPPSAAVPTLFILLPFWSGGPRSAHLFRVRFQRMLDVCGRETFSRGGGLGFRQFDRSLHVLATWLSLHLLSLARSLACCFLSCSLRILFSDGAVSARSTGLFP